MWSKLMSGFVEILPVDRGVWGKKAPGRNWVSVRAKRQTRLREIAAGARDRLGPEVVPFRAARAVERIYQRMRAREIIAETAVIYELSAANILGKSRVVEVCFARAEAIYRVRRELGVSFDRIARMFNRLDHTTVRSAIRSHARRIDGDWSSFEKISETSAAWIARRSRDWHGRLLPGAAAA